jgi:AcrR family transcriptional regulator
MIIKNKNEIIRKAIPVFNREGIQGASVAAIAKEIGIVKGTLYYYFDSKDDLLRHCLEYVKKRAIEGLHEGTEGITSYREYIQRVVKNCFVFPRRFPEGLAFLDLYMHTDFYRKESFTIFPLGIFTNIQFDTAGDYSIRENIPPDLINFLIGNVFTIVNRYILSHPEETSESIKALEKNIFDMVWNMITGKTSEE